jgi:hypothetical protein
MMFVKPVVVLLLILALKHTKHTGVVLSNEVREVYPALPRTSSQPGFSTR